MEPGPAGGWRLRFAAGTADARILAIVRLLEAQAGKNISVNELARTVNLSASRLEHLFKQHARCSIRQFVRQTRLEKAANLIVGTTERISVISYSVGFSDVSNFNHSFKREFGISPKELRAAPSVAVMGRREQQDLPGNSRYHQLFEIAADA